MKSAQLELKPIGILHSPFKEKFGIPRQAGLIQSCSAEIELYSPYNDINAVKGLEEFSDIWVIFAFHQNQNRPWKPLVRPPRLGGNKKIGVFASRAPFRPNNLGLSRIALRKIEYNRGKLSLIVACPDMVDGTPIYDIKPYIHYADSNAKAKCGFAPDTPQSKQKVFFTPASLEDLNILSEKSYPDIKNTITEILQYDPRPAYKADYETTTYGFKLYDLNIVWQFDAGSIKVLSIRFFNQAPARE